MVSIFFSGLWGTGISDVFFIWAYVWATWSGFSWENALSQVHNMDKHHRKFTKLVTS